MYKAAVRALLRRSIKNLNQGDVSLLLKLAAPDASIAFPGNNSWASMYHDVVKGRHRHDTHRGIAECEGFANRFVGERIQFVIEDILVNGPPWNTRVALRVHNFIAGPNNIDVYNNRAVAFLEIRWGKLHRWEDYEDTQRVAAWDQSRDEA